MKVSDEDLKKKVLKMLERIFLDSKKKIENNDAEFELRLGPWTVKFDEDDWRGCI